MGEIYHAAYEKREGFWRTICEPNLCLPQHAPQIPGSGWFGVGSGFAMYGETLKKHYTGQIFASDSHVVPQAGAIAEFSVSLFAAGQGMDAAEAIPFYLRDKVALKTSER